MSGMFDTKTDKVKRKAEATQKELKAKRKSRIITICVVTVLAFTVAASILLNSNLLRRTLTVVSIDGVSFNTAEFEYFYNSEYLNISNSYRQQGLDFLLPDINRPLSRQMFYEAENQTWADIVTENAFGRMRDIVAVYNVSKNDARYEMAQEKLDEIDNMLLMHEYEAMMSGYPSVEIYLQAVYGTAMNIDIYRSLLELVYTTEDYAVFIRDSFSYTDDQVNSSYAENADIFDVFKYRVLTVSAEYPDVDAEDFDAELEENINTARQSAHDTASSISDEQDFISAAFETDIFSYSEPDSTLREYQGSQLEENSGLPDTQFASWLRDPGRQSGDVTVINTQDGAAVLYFISRDDNNYHTVGMRQLLISREDVSPDDFPEGISDPGYIEAVDNAQLEAQERADNVWSLFTDAGSTEDALISLREEHSDPDGSSDGLFEDIAKLPYRGWNIETMKVVPELEQWLFENGRAIGDSALIETDYGFHLVYLTGFGDVLSAVLAEDKMRADDMDAWFESLNFADVVKHRAFILVTT